jgi:phytoene desaturase
MSSTKKTCVVVGSGIAGIAASIRLAHKGYKVTVYEKNNSPGGKLSQFELKGYRFDFGPSLFTLPENVEELFYLCGKNPADYFQYVHVNPGHRYFCEDGTIFDAYHTSDKFSEEASKVFGEPRETIKKYLEEAGEKYRVTKDMFLVKSLHKLKSYLSKASFMSFLNSYKLEVFSTLHKTNSSKFKNKKLVRFFNRFATYNGSSPYKAPATLSLISHLEIELGVYYPIGGMNAITASLYNLALEMGVQFEFGNAVNEIVIESNKVSGVKTNKGIYKYDFAVSNMDVYYTYHQLLPTVKRPEKILQQEKSSAAIVFYWGIKKKFPELRLHNILWSEQYEEEFNALVNKKWIHEDPTIYINITSKLSPEDAPSEGENWFVMINAPHDAGQDWTQLMKEVRTNVIQKINRMLKVNIESLIECEEVLNPVIMDEKTKSAFGALYGNSSNNRFASFLRHPNFHSKIRNLYFCGGTVHPGGGIPLCLMSAKIVADLMEDVH